MKLSIIGAGVVGEATGVGFNMQGHDVLFYDIDKKKLASLKIKGYSVKEDILEAVHDSDIIFICVPTPTVNNRMDFSHVKSAVTSIAKALGEVRQYRVVVVRSTVLPSTTRCKVIPLLQRHSKLKAGKDFGVCMNPEFLKEKHSLQDFLNPSRIVIGEFDKQSGDPLESLYGSFKAPIFRTDLDTAEMIKYVANVFLATKISFFNEIYIICQELGLNADSISKVVSLDPRIGEYGVYGGRPFEGGCLPKDLEAFLNFVKGKGINPKLLEEVFRINHRISSYCSKDEQDNVN